MIQTHQQLKVISEEYNSFFSINEFYPIQKAYSTPHFIVLGVRFPGRSISIYIGRGNQYQGVYLVDKFPPSYLRVQDRLLDYLRKYLVGARLGKMEVETGRNVFKFKFKNEQADNSFVFGYKDRQLFFIKQSLDENYLSWTGELLCLADKDIALNLLNPDKESNSKDTGNKEINNYLDSEFKKMSGQSIQKKKEKFLQKKILNISNDFEVVKKWKLIQHDLNNDILDLDTDELKIYGQNIKINKESSVWQKKDVVFKKIKKLKRAEEILSQRLLDSEKELVNVQKGEFEFETTKEKIIQPLWITHLKTQKNTNTEINKKEFQINKLTGVIGLDASANDWIRSNSSKEHYWFHVDNYTGSHCILKTDNLSQLSINDLNVLASMIRDFSKLSILEIPIVYTQVKNIKGDKGSKGKVIVKKPKYLRCPYIEWKEIITVI